MIGEQARMPGISLEHGNTYPCMQSRKRRYSDSSSSGEEGSCPGGRQRLLMRPWLIKKLDSGEVPGLCWLNNEKTSFKIAWKHASSQTWKADKDACIFQQWAIHTGKYNPGSPNPKRMKANFRCALNSLPDIEEDNKKSQTRGPNAYKVYNLLPAKPPRRGLSAAPNHKRSKPCPEFEKGNSCTSQRSAMAKVIDSQVMPGGLKNKAAPTIPLPSSVVTSFHTTHESIPVSQAPERTGPVHSACAQDQCPPVPQFPCHVKTEPYQEPFMLMERRYTDEGLHSNATSCYNNQTSPMATSHRAMNDISRFSDPYNGMTGGYPTIPSGWDYSGTRTVPSSLTSQLGCPLPVHMAPCPVTSSGDLPWPFATQRYNQAIDSDSDSGIALVDELLSDLSDCDENSDSLFSALNIATQACPISSQSTM